MKMKTLPSKFLSRTDSDSIERRFKSSTLTVISDTWWILSKRNNLNPRDKYLIIYLKKVTPKLPSGSDIINTPLKALE